MTLKEFKAKHGDIVLDEIRPDEVDGLATGAALFYASLSGKNGPKEDKKILWAGHVMTMGLDHANDALLLLRVTGSGYATVDSMGLDALRPDGRTILCRTAPFSGSDPRNRKPWTKWD